MKLSALEQLAGDIPSLQAAFVTVMPDCLLFDSWVREGIELEVEEVAAYFGDLVRANREGLKTLGSWSSDMQVTIEAADKLIILREITADFVCVTIFTRNTPLGMVRLHLRRLVHAVEMELPKFDAEKRPRGVRITEFLHRYAPDPHAVLLRLSLRTGLSLDQLQAPETLSSEQVAQLEDAAAKILGLDSLNL